MIPVLLLSETPLAEVLWRHQAARTRRRDLPIRPFVLPSAPTPEQRAAVADQIRALDNGGGVLVLVEADGETAANLAFSLLAELPITIVSGLNLPMLAAIVRQAQEAPAPTREALAKVARDGGQRGIAVTTGGRR